MKVLQACDLAVGYGTRTVVNDINLDALKGQFICLLGPNGSGKSTILRCLAGLLAPLRGSVYLKGNQLYTLGPGDLARTMAVVLTERLSPGLLTAFEVVAMGRYPYTDFWGHLTEKDRCKTQEALRLVNGENLATRYFAELSDGEKQKVMLARALAQEPELIILDEPTTHLDVKHRLEVMAILRQLTREKGITVILSLHEIDLALKSCAIAMLVKEGKILACGPPEEVLDEDTVTELYDIDSAYFSDCLGGMELRNNGGTLVYVLGGAGSGARVYRMLSKHGFGVVTGVIHENDVDYHVGKAIGATLIEEQPFEEIGDSSFERAVELIRRAARVIDAGFPVGSLNLRNLDLIRLVLAQGRTVYTLRGKRETEELYGEAGSRFIHCHSLGDLLEKLTSNAHATG
ncbi:Iron-chelate-transporting ATPase [Desulfofundulus kuznetsovii DSM 6115]|uniref:Iron-chelate-transporting ATPase n=1 Tax=Desulfofundulus kuznetsovii (strain DSM 6115 / VKM B-1805 / 17) TaxID=760568 RepID=A0AAU8PP02_DESK7|nr:Iron-chelate-transporting ATPase [Desulfofundulus kuznetsovii DSM 6115]